MPNISGGSSGGAGAVTQIGGSTASATVASFNFANIPQTFNCLQLVVNAHMDLVGGAGLANLKFNNDSSALYDAVNSISQASGALTIAVSSGATAARIAAITATSLLTATGLVNIFIPAYAGTTFYKTWTGTGGRKDTDAGGAAWVNENPWGSYRSTNAVTQITVLPVGISGTAQNFVAGSSAFLYGLT